MSNDQELRDMQNELDESVRMGEMTPFEAMEQRLGFIRNRHQSGSLSQPTKIIKKPSKTSKSPASKKPKLKTRVSLNDERGSGNEISSDEEYEPDDWGETGDEYDNDDDEYGKGDRNYSSEEEMMQNLRPPVKKKKDKEKKKLKAKLKKTSSNTRQGRVVDDGNFEKFRERMR